MNQVLFFAVVFGTLRNLVSRRLAKGELNLACQCEW